MRNRFFRVILCFAAICCLLLPAAAWGENSNKVVDGAHLFSLQEAEELQRLCAGAAEETGLDVVIVTTADAGGKSAEAYADDFFDYNGYGIGGDYSGVLLLIDMDNRIIHISTCGLGIRYFTDARIEATLDVLYPDVAAGRYAAAARSFVKQVKRYQAAGIPGDQYNYDTETGERDEYYKRNIWKQLGTSALISLPVAALLMLIAGGMAKVSNGKKITVQERTYLQGDSFHLLEKRDAFIRESVQRRRINDSDSSGGGSSGSSGGRSSTHTSSSGRSHGGGGRSF